MLEALKQRISEKANEIIEIIKLPEEERNVRFEICKGCEHLGKMDFCKICGCYMPAKTYMPDVSCPLSKWGPKHVDKNHK